MGCGRANNVIVLQPISTEGMTTEDVNGLAERTRSEMLKALEEMAKDPDSRSLNAQIDGHAEKKRN